MSELPTLFLDLDAIVAAAFVKPITAKLGGVIHELQPLSVESWVANMQATKALRQGIADLDEEVNTMIGIVTRSFPTMFLADIRKLPLASLNKLIAFVQVNSGGVAATKEAETEVAKNPPVTSDQSTSDSSSVA